jgi:hypothetical protein
MIVARYSSDYSKISAALAPAATNCVAILADAALAAPFSAVGVCVPESNSNVTTAANDLEILKRDWFRTSRERVSWSTHRHHPRLA